MADKNPIDSALAASIHQAEYETGKANAAVNGQLRGLAVKVRRQRLQQREGRCS